MDANSLYEFRRPRGVRRPILISAPHVGTAIPQAIADHMQAAVVQSLPDTDWYVHELYGFCVDLGISLLHARFSRYVVDLNRPTDGPALYADKRRQTDVVPRTDFDGRDLYKAHYVLDAAERQRRIDSYYKPYHQAIERELAALKQEFGTAVLFDAHSIRRYVPSIDSKAFPDLIVGDRDGTSAAPHITTALRRTLEASPFQVSYNAPFKGGQITRAFGRPADGIHAVQLEMSQDLYLDTHRVALDPLKLKILQPLLEQALLALAEATRLP